MSRNCKLALVASVAASASLLCLAASRNPKPAAQDPKPAAAQVPTMFTPADIKWVDAPPALPAGAKAAVLLGDSSKPEQFAMRLKLPANYKIAPHFHPGPENVTVISGTFHVAVGDSFDAAKAKELPAGSFASVPPKTHHFAFTKEETVIQLNSVGPWELIYVNPADDPRNNK